MKKFLSLCATMVVAGISLFAQSSNVGIGTDLPHHKLDLGSTAGSSATDLAGKKLAVYEDASGADFYGLGMSSGLLQFHTASTPTEAPGMVLTSSGNVGIGTTAPNANALLELSSIAGGFLPPKLTTAQRDAITPKPAGLMIYNIDVNRIQYWNTTVWVNI